MSREEIQRLLGGYATDTLSETERRALFAAALEDQELFDALAKEQALREVLEDPAARQQLLAALRPTREPLATRVWISLRRPAVLAMAAGAAGILIVAGLMLWQKQHTSRHEVMVADAIVRRQEPAQNSPAPRKVFQAPAAHLAKKMAPLPPPAAPAVNSVIVESESRAVTMAAPRAAQPRDALLQFNEAAAKIVRPALPYTFLVRAPDGSYAPLPSGAVIHPGDSVRVQVEPGEAGFVHLFRRGDTGWVQLSSQPAAAGQHYILPSEPGLESASPARVELLLVLSHAPQVDPESLAGAQAVSRILLEYQ